MNSMTAATDEVISAPTPTPFAVLLVFSEPLSEDVFDVLLSVVVPLSELVLLSVFVVGFDVFVLVL